MQELSTEELQTAAATDDDHVTLDKQTIEQLRQAHKQLKVELQTVTRSGEKKKAKLEKEREQKQKAIKKTAALQVR